MHTLAQIAFDLRFANMTDEEDAQIPAPWGYQNIPQPVRVESSLVPSVGRGTKAYIETVEHFADGSSFARAS